MEYVAVVTTVANHEEARRLARALVERQLAACAHISEIESVYFWKGAVQEEREQRVVFKTTEDRYEAVERAIKELHSYEVPAIYAVPLARVYAPYAAWIDTMGR